MRNFLVCIILFLTTYHASFGQAYKYIGVTEGLSDHRVLSIQKDNRGFMWFLTYRGIDRYDGNHFKHYSLQSEEGYISLFSEKTILKTDSKGNVWAISEQGQLFVYNPQTDLFVHKQLPPEITTKKIERIEMTDFDEIWYCYPEHCYTYDLNTTQIQQIQIEMPQEGFLRIKPNGSVLTPQSWRLKETAIPKISLDLGSHLHNMVQFLTRETPIKIVADQATFGNFNQVIDNVSALAQYSNNIKVQFWFSKTALGHRNGLRVRIYGNKGSAEWFQLEPETLKLCDAYGNISLLDRTSDNFEIANASRYNRFKAGHPAGFIEAFANYYKDIADCLKEYKQTGSYKSSFVCGIKDSLESLVLMETAAKSAETLKWETVPEVLI